MAARLVNGNRRAPIKPGQHAQEKSAVTHIARHGTANAQGEPSQSRRRIRHAPRRRANANHVAKVGRVAQRTAHITTVRERHHAARQRNRAATCASATSLGQVVRIQRRPENRIERLRTQAPLRHIGFADDNSACFFLALDHQTILIRNIFRVQRRSVCRSNALGKVQIFHAHRKTMQRAKPIPFRDGFVRGQSLRHQLFFRNQRDNRIDLGIDTRDLPEMRLHHLPR